MVQNESLGFVYYESSAKLGEGIEKMAHLVFFFFCLIWVIINAKIMCLPFEVNYSKMVVFVLYGFWVWRCNESLHGFDLGWLIYGGGFNFGKQDDLSGY